jgi:hypothetical protein
VKPPTPQLDVEPGEYPLLLPPVRTLTDPKVRSTRDDPHWTHGGRASDEYSDMDMRTSNGAPQSRHW